MRQPTKLARDILVILLLCNVIVHAPFLLRPVIDTEADYFYTAIAIGDNHFNFFTPTIEEKPPLLFILPSFFMKIFPSMLWGRIESLIAATIALLYTYLLGKSFHSSFVGLMAVILCMFFPMFAVQSIFFTDAMLVTAVFLASLYYFMTKQKKAYFISATLALLTKESLILVPLLLFLFTVASRCVEHRSISKKDFQENAYLLLPISALVLWSLLNKIYFGYVFYPGNTKALIASINNLHLIYTNAGIYMQRFIQQANGSVIYYVGSLLYVLYYVRHIKKQDGRVRMVVLFLLIVGAYLVFFGHFFNWDLRYVLFLYPLVFILFANIVYKYFSKFVSCLIVITVCFIFIRSQWQMAVNYPGSIVDEAIDIRFAAQQQYVFKIIKQLKTLNPDIPIYTDYQMAHYLWNPLFGYVSSPGDNVFQIDSPITRGDCPVCICEKCVYPNEIPRQQKIFLLWREEWNEEISDLKSFCTAPLMTIEPDWPMGTIDKFVVYEYYNPANFGP